jgi:regulator of replication initiation timing
MQALFITLESLSQHISDLSQHISDLSQHISDLSQQIPDLSQQFSDLSQQFSDLSQQIPDLSFCNYMNFIIYFNDETIKTNKQVKQLQQKQFVCFFELLRKYGYLHLSTNNVP